jgi:hypothetical protein
MKRLPKSFIDKAYCVMKQENIRSIFIRKMIFEKRDTVAIKWIYLYIFARSHKEAVPSLG